MYFFSPDTMNKLKLWIVERVENYTGSIGMLYISSTYDGAKEWIRNNPRKYRGEYTRIVECYVDTDSSEWEY